MGPDLPDSLFDGGVDSAYVVLEPYFQTLGGVFQLLTLGGAFAGLWIWSDDLKLPVVTLVASTAALHFLPARARTIMSSVMTLTIVAGIFRLWERRTGRDGAGRGGL